MKIIELIGIGVCWIMVKTARVMLRIANFLDTKK
jgi:hypothetical protein